MECVQEGRGEVRCLIADKDEHQCSCPCTAAAHQGRRLPLGTASRALSMSVQLPCLRRRGEVSPPPPSFCRAGLACSLCGGGEAYLVHTVQRAPDHSSPGGRRPLRPWLSRSVAWSGTREVTVLLSCLVTLFLTLARKSKVLV